MRKNRQLLIKKMERKLRKYTGKYYYRGYNLIRLNGRLPAMD
jgi:hypothetical protein